MAYSKLEVEKSDNIGLETELRFLPAQGRAQLCNILNSDSGKLYYISYKCMFFTSSTLLRYICIYILIFIIKRYIFVFTFFSLNIYLKV